MKLVYSFAFQQEELFFLSLFLFCLRIEKMQFSDRFFFLLVSLPHVPKLAREILPLP